MAKPAGAYKIAETSILEKRALIARHMKRMHAGSHAWMNACTRTRTCILGDNSIHMHIDFAALNACGELAFQKRPLRLRAIWNPAARDLSFLSKKFPRCESYQMSPHFSARCPPSHTKNISSNKRERIKRENLTCSEIAHHTQLLIARVNSAPDSAPPRGPQAAALRKALGVVKK